MPRVALQYPADRQPASFEAPVFNYCYSSVIRARRIEATLGTEPWRQQVLIDTYQTNKELFHDAVCSRRSINSFRIVESTRVEE